MAQQYPRPTKPKNWCPSCGYDFSTLEIYEEHRSRWKVVRDHSEVVCTDLFDSRNHPRGECQKMVGSCLSPSSLGLTSFGESWYTEAGYERAVRMSALGKSRAIKEE